MLTAVKLIEFLQILQKQITKFYIGPLGIPKKKFRQKVLSYPISAETCISP